MRRGWVSSQALARDYQKLTSSCKCAYDQSIVYQTDFANGKAIYISEDDRNGNEKDVEDCPSIRYRSSECLYGWFCQEQTERSSQGDLENSADGCSLLIGLGDKALVACLLTQSLRFPRKKHAFSSFTSHTGQNHCECTNKGKHDPLDQTETSILYYVAEHDCCYRTSARATRTRLDRTYLDPILSVRRLPARRSPLAFRDLHCQRDRLRCLRLEQLLLTPQYQRRIEQSTWSRCFEQWLEVS
jgi:hypothetical protein